MLRSLVALLLLLSLPAFAAPVPKALTKPKAPDLTNTRWDIARDGNKGIAYKYHFQADGVLLHSVRGKEGRGRGTWAQKGDAVTLVYQGGTTVYTLAYIDGSLEGTAEAYGFVMDRKLIPAKPK